MWKIFQFLRTNLVNIITLISMHVNWLNYLNRIVPMSPISVNCFTSAGISKDDKHRLALIKKKLIGQIDLEESTFINASIACLLNKSMSYYYHLFLNQLWPTFVIIDDLLGSLSATSLISSVAKIEETSSTELNTMPLICHVNRQWSPSFKILLQ